MKCTKNKSLIIYWIQFLDLISEKTDRQILISVLLEDLKSFCTLQKYASKLIGNLMLSFLTPAYGRVIGNHAILLGPRQANLVLIAYASSEGSGEPAHPRSLARTFAARSYKQWIKRNLQTESQIRGPSEWLGMRGWNLSWRNARRHKFAWRGSIVCIIINIDNLQL